MAARTGTQAPVGSKAWILKEFNEISSLCENELEDFTFSARNEVEWLNEHMADILSSNGLNLAEIMKTPGKLRGKTPRTARQRSPLKEIRHPLGEIAPIDKRFNSPLRQSPAKLLDFRSQVENTRQLTAIEPVKKTVAVAVHDSGYHGSGESMEMEVELPATQDFEAYEEEQNTNAPPGVSDVAQTAPQQGEQRSTESSFHSAKENQTLKDISGDVVMKYAEPAHTVEAQRVSEQLRRESAEQIYTGQQTYTATDTRIGKNDQDEEMADASSDTSTPAKPVVRKGSLTFATLPAREPLATKKSMGNRISGQNAGLGRSSYYGRITGGKSLGAALHSDDEESGEDDQENQKPSLTREESDGTGAMVKLHSKSSTQRLHERISALSKTQAPRPTKSIPAVLAGGQAEYPTLPDTTEQEEPEKANEPTKSNVQTEQDEDESWIPKAPSDRPMTAPGQDKRSDGPKKQTDGSAQIARFQIHQDEGQEEKRPSTTPVASPPKHVVQQHGSLFASKSKLQSIMQSARGLFSSSAAASAQAKLEAGSVSSPKREKPEPQYPQLSKTASKDTPSVPEPRRTRSSTEKEERKKREEQELKEAQEDDLHGGDGTSHNVANIAAQHEEQSNQRPGFADEQDELAEPTDRPQTAMGPPARPRTMLQKPGTNRRPLVKPAKDQAPQPKVSIKIGSMAGRRPLTAASLSTATRNLDASTQQRPGTAAKKESTASHSTTASSAPSFKSSTVMTSKPKALLAAERKKEADEKAAQKKLEQKREIERRKQAQQEEAQRREQERQAAERQKEKERVAEEERKKQEQRQAVEKKRAEQMAKREQLQREAEHQQALKSSTYRTDTGPARPASRQATAQDFPRPPSAQPQGNPAKAPKRVWNPDQDEETQKARAQPGHNYQQTQDGKRRKTDEEEVPDHGPKRPAMAPPMRISNILKNGPKGSVFANYPRAPPPAPHHYGGQAQNGASQAHHKQPPYGHPSAQPPRPPTAMDIARFQNGAIPFAGAHASTNGPGPGPSHAPAPAPVQSAFKTPLQPSKYGQPQTQQAQQPKSSPFINGEYLHLDEIPTDSEEEDSEDEKERKANMPAWVLTPNLQQTLVDQETQNPDAVFGPIAPLNMEELFKDRKGQNRFRSRTSSANWFGADRLTDEEKIRDLEAREKIRKDGGWTFGL